MRAGAHPGPCGASVLLPPLPCAHAARPPLPSAPQERVLQLVRAGHNVFFTGNAGEASMAGALLGALLCSA